MTTVEMTRKGKQERRIDVTVEHFMIIASRLFKVVQQRRAVDSVLYLFTIQQEGIVEKERKQLSGQEIFMIVGAVCLQVFHHRNGHPVSIHRT